MPCMEYSIKSPMEIIFLILYAIITAPICEEAFFRAYGLSFLYSISKKKWIAAIICILGFSILHLPAYGIRGFIEIGLIWSILPMILYFWRKSIFPGIIMHSLNNLFWYIIVPLYIPILQ